MVQTKSKGARYPFDFKNSVVIHDQDAKSGQTRDVTLTLPNVRGRIPSIQTSRLRTMMIEAHRDPTKILAHACTMDGLTSRLVEEAGFPMVFLAGYTCASSFGYAHFRGRISLEPTLTPLSLPDTGYIAMQEMCDKIQQAVRQVSVPVMADGDTGYGSPMNVRRTVECYAHAGAAGIMIEDQTWPKSKLTPLRPRGIKTDFARMRPYQR